MVWRVGRDRGRRRPDGRDKRLRRIVCVEVAPGYEDATTAKHQTFSMIAAVPSGRRSQIDSFNATLCRDTADRFRRYRSSSRPIRRPPSPNLAARINKSLQAEATTCRSPGTVDCPGFLSVAVNLPKETFEACCYQVTGRGFFETPRIIFPRRTRVRPFPHYEDAWGD